VDYVLEVLVGGRELVDDLLGDRLDVFLSPERVVGLVLELSAEDLVDLLGNPLRPVPEYRLVCLVIHIKKYISTDQALNCLLKFHSPYFSR